MTTRSLKWPQGRSKDSPSLLPKCPSLGGSKGKTFQSLRGASLSSPHSPSDTTLSLQGSGPGRDPIKEGPCEQA